MPEKLSIKDFIATKSRIIDVRSPAEFSQGHIPGAHNMPLFSNEERAIIGTLYKQKSRDAAMLEGLRIVGPKMAPMVEEARDLAIDGRVAVHCWRGGERSASVAWLMEKAGFADVVTLTGGYKAFRNHVLRSFENRYDLRILSGYTGTGKTELLGHLKELGQQIVDLEDLANHKGSSYGAIGEDPQPSTEQFENLLWSALQEVDMKRPLWVEDESQMIGTVKIPDPFFAQVRNAFCYFADMPREERAARLVGSYGKYPKAELAAATKRIEKRLGPQHCRTALEALENGDLHSVAMITLTYYDKTYLHGLRKRDASRIVRETASFVNMKAIAEQAIKAHGEPINN
ncbi:MAG: tRNA 2-selenouridine(34) synthase MnmH [Flavobacteriales bacterium]|nr:tRNA 2-selenouridine(34) synthase MnmH [Flavobacteriales bacterium]